MQCIVSAPPKREDGDQVTLLALLRATFETKNTQMLINGILAGMKGDWSNVNFDETPTGFIVVKLWEGGC